MSSGETAAFGHLPYVMADRQAEIPDRIEKRLQKPLIVCLDSAGKQNEKVDVGVEAELPPAVAAKRKHADGLRCRAGLSEQLLNDGVHAV